jgi:protein-tyrosine phosphatase
VTDHAWRGLPAVRPDRPDLSPILDGLLVGEYPNPEDVAWLRDAHGVTAVLSLQDDADLVSKNLALAALERAYEAAGLRFYRVPVPDGATDVLGARLPAIVALLRELLAAGERVYLHCNAGMNRAPTAAIAYLHLHSNLSLAAARDLVKARRACVPYMRVLEAHFPARG